jgi:protein TonB
MFASRVHSCPSVGGEAFRGHPFTVSVAPQNHPVSEAPASSVPQAAGVRAEKLVLLANDESLIEALVSVVPPDSLTVVADEAALAGQLVGGQAGVAFIDCLSADSQPGRTAQLTRRLHQQLPDVVLIVAGDGAAQSEVAALVADGTIYRFVHKPVSAQRLKLFVDAAVRKRAGLSTGVYTSLPIAPQAAVAAPARVLPGPMILSAVAVAAVIVIGALGWLLLRSHSVTSANSARPATAPRSVQMVAAPSGTARNFNTPSPVPASAVSTSAKAAELDRLATAAEQALLAGNLAEATRLTAAARDVDPDHVRVKFLIAQIASEQARATQRRAAAGLSPDHVSASAIAAPPPAAGLPTPSARPSPSAPPAAAAPAASDSDTLALLPVVAASATTISVSAASAPAATAPSSTPPASEARDRNSVAAIVLQRVYSPDPEFPEVAREHDLTGFVDLEFTVLSDGSVSNVTVLKAQPVGVFEKSAVAAVSRWRYLPIARGGAPASQHARLRLNFAYK